MPGGLATGRRAAGITIRARPAKMLSVHVCLDLPELYSPKRCRRPGTRRAMQRQPHTARSDPANAAKQDRVPNRRSTSVATLTGQRGSSTLPPRDTPCITPAREVARAVPAGSRRARDQREALRSGLSCPDLAGVRADFRAHLTAWWRIHVNHASWGGEGRPPRGTTEPTRARTCNLAGMSISTYKRCSRWWRARGYIAVARAGMDPHASPGSSGQPGRPERAPGLGALPAPPWQTRYTSARVGLRR